MPEQLHRVKNEAQAAYYRAVCESIARYVEDGGGIRIRSSADEGQTSITFLVDSDTITPYIDGGTAHDARGSRRV